MLDYMDWRGDLPLERDPFNEVDNLVFAELCYMNMEKIVPSVRSGRTVPLSYMAEKYPRMYDQSADVNDPGPVLAKMAETARYSSVRAGRFVNRIETGGTKQFSAVTYWLPDGSAVCAFRGTDGTIVGWEEDFSLSYMKETPGQKDAVRYLDDLLEKTEGPVRVTGHSKGGNLAVYASCFCAEERKDRILEVYDNDGPGFLYDVLASEEYRRTLPKVHRIIPRSSIVGMLMGNKAVPRIVQSSASGAEQHNPLSWQVIGNHFVQAEKRSAVSEFWDQTFSGWLDGLAPSDRRLFVETVFRTMESTGLVTLADLKKNPGKLSAAVVNAAQTLPASEQKQALSVAGKLLKSGSGVLFEDVRESVGKLSEKAREKSRGN